MKSVSSLLIDDVEQWLTRLEPAQILTEQIRRRTPYATAQRVHGVGCEHLSLEEVIPVVDTVGAGDGFAVGVISALLEGMDLRQAAQRGNAIGARVVQFPGDCDGLPDRSQLQALLPGL